MTFVPSALRRTGYDLPTTPQPLRWGLCSLSPRRAHVLTEFVVSQPPRVLAELLLHVAAERLTVTETLDLVADWRARLTPEILMVTGGDRLPRPMLEVAP